MPVRTETRHRRAARAPAPLRGKPRAPSPSLDRGDGRRQVDPALVRVISGAEEGIYGFLAINFLAGRLRGMPDAAQARRRRRRSRTARPPSPPARIHADSRPTRAPCSLD